MSKLEKKYKLDVEQLQLDYSRTTGVVGKAKISKCIGISQQVLHSYKDEVPATLSSLRSVCDIVGKTIDNYLIEIQ